MTNLDMRNLPDHYPQRDDQVLAWLKDRRGSYGLSRDPDGAAGDALDDLIEEYEKAADDMLSLENVVNGVEDAGPSAIPKARKKKSKWEQKSPKEGPEF